MRQKLRSCVTLFCCVLCLQLASFPGARGGEGEFPDLVISGYGKLVEDNPWLHLRDAVAPGDTVVYTITITNQGNTTYEGPVNVGAYGLPESWQAEASTAQVTLPPYAQEQATYDMKVPVVIPGNAVPGEYVAVFRIEPVQGEERTYNNVHRVPINILPPQPDLDIVDIRWTPVNPSVFDRPDIEVIIRNKGTADAGAFRLELDVQVGSEAYTTHLEADVPGLKQGETLSWRFGEIQGTGTFSTRYNRNVVKAAINTDRRVTEHNYINNERVKYISVIEGPLHVDLDWKPRSPTTQDEIDFFFTVINEGGVRWMFPDYRRDGSGATIILRYWPISDFNAAKIVEEGIWVLGPGKSVTYHIREKIPEPGEYRVKCEIYAGYPYWTVTQTPEMALTVSAP